MKAKMEYFIGDWRLIAVRGVAAVLFGLGTLVWPDVTLWALVLMWGAFALVDGISSLTAAMGGGRGVVSHRGWLAFHGLTGIAAGVVTFVWPAITARALLYIIAAWAVVVGVAQIATAISMRKAISNEWTLGIAGLLSILFGAVLVITPGTGALALTWAIGWYALVSGAAMLRLAWKVRRETKRVEAPRASVRPSARSPVA